jgi:hypothetical protein
VGGQTVSMIETNRPVGARAYTSATTVNSEMRPGKAYSQNRPCRPLADSSTVPPPPVQRKLATLSLLLAWLCANGALLDGVQVFAWAKMFAGYTQTMSVAAALRETFDPAKPCEMCLGVAAAKDTAKKQLPASVENSTEKIVLALEAANKIVPAPAPEAWPPMATVAALSRSEAVPVPPPRA